MNADWVKQGLDELHNFERRKAYFVAIDSDGCAFDTMEIKHKECFIPNIIKYWELQAVSKYARAAAEFVNLYSRWRGINRFPALIKAVDLLREWPEVQRRNPRLPDLTPLQRWVEREDRLGNPALQAEVQRTGDPVLARALEWSEAVNATIADMVRGVPPFPGVRESLERLAGEADVIVCSATPLEALVREWEEHGIDRYVRLICGQELGSKREHIHRAAAGKYEPQRMLMIGDAPGDLKAARANGARFFPVNPGHEEESWDRFVNEGLERFLSDRYDEAYESQLVAEFERLLPETPPWKR
ncbi:MAG: HAD family hydrolase [Acidobacteriota bacterium]